MTVNPRRRRLRFGRRDENGHSPARQAKPGCEGPALNGRMPCGTSVERIGITKGMLIGRHEWIHQGESQILRRQLTRRFVLRGTR
jgi:hypothetical protein